MDHAATTPVHPEVADKMVNVLKEAYGNPSSIHSYGRQARHILDQARELIANSIGARYSEIIFTSGGTEADNLALTGTARANRDKGMHIITTQIEHHAVLHTCERLEEEGFLVTYLPVDESGRITVRQVEEALTPETILVSVMYGNNEVGSIQPIKEIGALLQNHQAYFHTDAVQAYGLEKLDVRELNVDLMSVSSHKINGPKGIGFLFAKDGTKFQAGLFGGEQEMKRRAGTENLPAIAGFAEAVRILGQAREQKYELYRDCRNAFLEMLDDESVLYRVNGPAEQQSLPHVLNISFPKTDVESLLVNLDLAGIAASSGSACTAGSIEPSHVLSAMYGKNSDRLRSSVRFSFGFGNTVEQVKEAARLTGKIVKRFQK